ncbi:MAG: hypothetical protein Q9227_000232 [Pyrenula ochraceoflavens]
MFDAASSVGSASAEKLAVFVCGDKHVEWDKTGIAGGNDGNGFWWKTENYETSYHWKDPLFGGGWIRYPGAPLGARIPSMGVYLMPELQQERDGRRYGMYQNAEKLRPCRMNGWNSQTAFRKDSADSSQAPSDLQPTLDQNRFYLCDGFFGRIETGKRGETRSIYKVMQDGLDPAPMMNTLDALVYAPEFIMLTQVWS